MSKFTLTSFILLTVLNACNYNSIDIDELNTEDLRGNLQVSNETCNSSDPINDINWLKEMIEKNPTNHCNIIEAIHKGNYKGDIIFMPYYITATESFICCGCSGVIAYDCMGELIAQPCSQESQEIKYDEIIDVEVIYKVTDEVLTKQISYLDSLYEANRKF